LPVLDDREYFALMGLLLVVAVLMVFERGADLIQAQSVTVFSRRRIPGAANDIEREWKTFKAHHFPRKVQQSR